MQDSKQLGLDSYARNLIRHKARQLIGKYGFTWDDYEDLCQEMILDLLTRLPRFDPGKASLNTFVTRVVNRRVANLIRDRMRAKRDHRREGLSFDEQVEQGDCEIEEGDGAGGQSNGDLLRDCQGHPEADGLDLRLDVSRAISSLPPDLKLLAELLLIHSIADAARELGVSRATLYEKGIAPVRRAFVTRRLTAYLTTLRRFDRRRRK
jgi:RNA polymerase sigma-70 factor, ECF subfamily